MSERGDIFIPKDLLHISSTMFDRFCIRNGLDNIGPGTNEIDMFVRVGVFGDMNQAVRLTLAPDFNDEGDVINGDINVTVEVAADNGQRYLPFKTVSSFRRFTYSTRSFGRQLAPRLAKGLRDARALTTQDLSEQRLKF